jgi:integrase/recombinase XerC
LSAGLPDEHPAHRTAADWGDHLRRDRRRSVHTVRAYVATAHRLVDFLGGHRAEPISAKGLATLTQAELRAFLASRRNDGIGNASAARELSAVRGFLAFAADRASAGQARRAAADRAGRCRRPRQ